MDTFNRVLLILHFLGLAMGFSVSFSNMVMGALINKAAPGEKPVLARFPPAITRVGDIGLVLLWLSGLGLLFFKWGGLSSLGDLPWTFHLKLTLVVILTGLIGFIHSLQRKAMQGDEAAAARIQAAGKAAFLTAVTIVVLAVVSFD
jgi:hypothetical protein